MTIGLIAHGGAGRWRPGSDDDAMQGLRAAVEAGRAVLAGGGTALDAVCATVVVLEDNPIYNAGTGAVLNFDGFCEMDACVMEVSSHALSQHRVDGVIYDVTNVPQWKNGEHNGYSAGNDLTDIIKNKSPHGVKQLKGIPVVGKLVAG